MMKETNASIKENFEQKYPIKKIMGNPLACTEAIGYLKALIEYSNYNEPWAEQRLAMLLLIL